MCFFIPLVAATWPSYSALLDSAWTGRKLRWLVVSPSDHLSQTWLIRPPFIQKAERETDESGSIAPGLMFQAPKFLAVPGTPPLAKQHFLLP